MAVPTGSVRSCAPWHAAVYASRSSTAAVFHPRPAGDVDSHPGMGMSTPLVTF